MTSAHVWAALAAVAIAVSALSCGERYAQRVEQRYVSVLGPIHLPVKTLGPAYVRQAFAGSALQKAAFRQPDLLPVYGASEVYLFPSRYQPAQFFRKYPTGFATFEVAKGGAHCITIAQAIAAIGPDLNGRKVVISYTPELFEGNVAPETYAGHFSRLHANELVFSPTLSSDVKQTAAARMLQFPRPLKKDPLLEFALRNLAAGPWLKQIVLGAALWPLGRLQTQVIELQDHWETVVHIRAIKRPLPAVERRPAPLDWKALAAEAVETSRLSTTNNPFGFRNQSWRWTSRREFAAKPPGSQDAEYTAVVTSSTEWADLDLLLHVLKELNARPLLIGRPFKAAYYDATGVSEKARDVFYAKLRRVAAKYGVPVVSFQQRDTDAMFTGDMVGHTDAEGWVYVDQVLDAFYHGRLSGFVE